MRSAILVISLVTAAAAEAPYNLPRPSLVFSYAQPALPAPPPARLPHLSLFPHLPQPHGSHEFNHQSSYSQPGYNYAQPHSQIQSRPQPQSTVTYSRPQQVYLQASTGYRQPQIQPSLTYAPQIQPSLTYAPQLPAEHIRPLQAFAVPHQQSPTSYYQQQRLSQDQRFSHQEPQSVPFISKLTLQSQTISNFPSSLSSYQADSNQYNAAAQSQTHSDVLDPTVVNQVQNIIKETEHTSAREAGFLSLVSGITLENVKPSIEITSFIQNSPLSTGSTGLSSFSSSSSSSSVEASNLSSPVPVFTSNSQSSAGSPN